MKWCLTRRSRRSRTCAVCLPSLGRTRPSSSLRVASSCNGAGNFGSGRPNCVCPPYADRLAHGRGLWRAQNTQVFLCGYETIRGDRHDPEERPLDRSHPCSTSDAASRTTWCSECRQGLRSDSFRRASGQRPIRSRRKRNEVINDPCSTSKPRRRQPALAAGKHRPFGVAAAAAFSLRLTRRMAGAQIIGLRQRATIEAGAWCK